MKKVMIEAIELVGIKKLVMLAMASVVVGFTLAVNAVDSSAFDGMKERYIGGESLSQSIERQLVNMPNSKFK